MKKPSHEPVSMAEGPLNILESLLKIIGTLRGSSGPEGSILPSRPMEPRRVPINSK